MTSKKIVFTICLFSLIFSSCNTNVFESSYNERTSVTLVENEHYSIISHDQISSEKNANIAYLLPDKNEINYVLNVDSNYYLRGTDYSHSVHFFIGEGKYSLTLQDIKHSIRVSLFLEKIVPDDDSSSAYYSSNQEDVSSFDDHSSIAQESKSSSSSQEPQSSQNSQSSSSEYKPRNEITYDANGGEYILFNGQKMNMVIYSTIHHPRPNTSIGTNIMKRDGYTLIGWNTNQDGSGVHIGLGSRYLDLQKDTFTLYAEWVKQNESSFFEYEENESAVKIIKCTSNENTICIPELINNKPVTIIGSKAFENADTEIVILPKTIKTVEKSAFFNTRLKHLYFYDNVETISDSSFNGCDDFSTIHINAIEAPRYVTADRHSPYADKIDRLIINQGKKKIIIAGGSGAYYSVDACELKKAYPSYEPFNVALNGSFNSFIQYDIIGHYIEKDDVFLHCVESCGYYQFLKFNAMADYDDITGFDCRFMNALELNYDLLSLTDVRNVASFFDVFAAFNAARLNKTPEDYTDYTLFADSRGDYTSDPNIRTKSVPHAVYDDDYNIIKPAAISEEGAIDRNCYNEDGFTKLCAYYSLFSKKGANLFFMFSCVNKGSLTESELDSEHVQAFEDDVRNGIDSHINIINRLEYVIFDSDRFSDSDWHLDYVNAIAFTQNIIGWLGGL